MINQEGLIKEEVKIKKSLEQYWINLSKKTYKRNKYMIKLMRLMTS